jgi:hypothetical protein
VATEAAWLNGNNWGKKIKDEEPKQKERKMKGKT